MKRLSIIPEIFIWLAFSVLTGFGYAFSFFEYIGGRAEMSALDIVIPTLVWLVLAAFCAFLLRQIKLTGRSVQLTVGEGLFLEISVLLLLLAAGWVFRFMEPFRGVWPANLDNPFFEVAKVDRNEYWHNYKSAHPASRIYIYFLHFLFLVLGNIYEAGALAQFVFLMAGAVFWYMAVRKSLGVITALFTLTGAMLLPDSIIASVQYNPMMLLFAFYGLVAWLLASLAESTDFLWLTAIGALVAGIFVGAAPLLDISGWLLVFISFFAWAKQWRRHQGKGFVVTIAGFMGTIAGFGSCGYTMYYLWRSCVKRMAPFLGMGDMALDFPIEEQIAGFLGYGNIDFQLPELKQVQQFVFSLSDRPIFIAAIIVIAGYWFMKKRFACTWIMAGILGLFSLKLLNLDVHMQHDFLIYLGFLMLLGVAVQEFIIPEKQLKSEETVSEYRHGMVKVDLADTTELPDLSFMNESSGLRQAERSSVMDSIQTVSVAEPEVTIINFDEEKVITVPEKPKDTPVIFIPKSMEIPKRVSKPKVEYTMEVTEEQMHFDVNVDENADFDL